VYPLYINYFVWFSVDLYYYVEFLFIIKLRFSKVEFVLVHVVFQRWCHPNREGSIVAAFELTRWRWCACRVWRAVGVTAEAWCTPVLKLNGSAHLTCYVGTIHELYTLHIAFRNIWCALIDWQIKSCGILSKAFFKFRKVYESFPGALYFYAFKGVPRIRVFVIYGIWNSKWSSKILMYCRDNSDIYEARRVLHRTNKHNVLIVKIKYN